MEFWVLCAAVAAVAATTATSAFDEETNAQIRQNEQFRGCFRYWRRHSGGVYNVMKDW